MIVKFHNKSERIKGLSFHPKRPWLLAGLHNGNIQLWDYKLGQVIENFQLHEGPVRSVQFHPTVPLFVSASDDFTVRVWNFKAKKCVFVLRGHLDYVRCVHIHPELPWVISGSDDSTARLWNYQSRQLMAVMAGHSHYIMQCQFHHSQDILITCSLDQTIRLWSFAQLRRKFTNSRTDFTSEIELIQILEGHNQGVNWCSFHPSQNLIISGGDDKKIKQWKFNDTRCWEVDGFTGHTTNVTSVIYHPHADVAISCSEDKTTRVWDLKKKLEVDCFTSKEMDRFWVVAAHPDNYYFAAGSDGALYIFTLYKDRPPMDLVSQNQLCIGYQKQIKYIDLRTFSEKVIKNLSDLPSLQENILQDNIEQIQYNPYDNSKQQIMIRLKQNQHNKTKNTAKFVLYETSSNIIQMFLGKSAVFVGKSKVVRSKESSELELYNYETDQHTLINFRSEKVFALSGGKILFYQLNKLLIVDPITHNILQSQDCTAEFSHIKRVAANQSFISIQTKKNVYIFTKTLQKIAQVHDYVNVKSLLWLSDAQNVLLYSTKVHLKYLLLNGDGGVLRTTENIMYLVQIQQPVDQGTTFKIIFMDNQWQIQTISVDCQELIFKQSLFDKNLKSINNLLNQKKHLGEGLVVYLHKKNQSQLAINLISDKQAKFQLALNSHNLELAYKTSQDIKDKKSQQLLYEESLIQGNHNLMEASLKNMRLFDKLSFLYLSIGNLDNLSMLNKLCSQQNLFQSCYQISLYNGNIDDRLQLLKKTPFKHLYNLLLKQHGFEYDNQLLNQEDIEWLDQQNSEALIPPQPLFPVDHIIISSNWPHNFIAEEDMLQIQGDDSKVIEEIQKSKVEEIIVEDKPIKKEQVEDDDDEFQDCKQWGLDDEQLATSPTKLEPLTKTSLDQKSLRYGYPDFKKALSFGEQVFVEQYEGCIKGLEKQIAIKNKQPIIDYMKLIALQSVMEVTQIPFVNSQPWNIQEGDKLFINIDVKSQIKYGYKLTTEGKFKDAHDMFKQILQSIPFSKNAETIQICVNYIIAMKCEIAKQNQPIARQIELGCYMAVCELQAVHRALCLRSAMSLAYKNKNYITASQLGRYLIKLLKAAPSNTPYAKPEVLESTKKIITMSDQQASNEHKIDFEESYLMKGVQILACDKLQVLDKLFQCPFDQSYHSQKKLCCICDLSQVGEQTIGLRL